MTALQILRQRCTKFIRNFASRIGLIGCLLILFAPGAIQADLCRSESDPLVIGHRGASGYLPENTLESMELAIKLGADYIETDLVATGDGHLIARHEPNLIYTTNVDELPKFAERRRKAVINGVEEEGFFASDFTLEEIRLLGAVQRVKVRNQEFNGVFAVPTFEEIVDFAKNASEPRGCPIGVYAELKNPTYHKSIDLPLEGRVLEVLEDAGWNRRDAPVFLQSFETASLKYLRRHSSVRLVQLVAASSINPGGSLVFEPPYDRPFDWTTNGDTRLFKDLLTDEGLAEVRTYADVIAPWKYFLIRATIVDDNNDRRPDDLNGDGSISEADFRLLGATDIVTTAQEHGLEVHSFTFRNEPHRFPSDYQGNPMNEYRRFYALGVDGVFSDFPGTAVAARAIFEHDAADR